jgi:SAM-dependent methyltransferase
MHAVPIRGSYAAVFTSALRGEPCDVVGLTPEPRRLPVADWSRAVDGVDLALLSECRGETLDVGCGPGRMTRALAERGHPALGIDVVPEAVRMTRARGGAAIVRDVFETLPGEGRWTTVLLADGNIGIGGDPRALLTRIRILLRVGGRVVVELAEPGTGVVTRQIVLQTLSIRSRPFTWSVVGAESVGALAVASGLAVRTLDVRGGRWFAVLEKRR